MESAAPDVIFLILKNLETPVELYRLISASPTCLRVFNQRPVHILSNILKPLFPAHNLYRAVALLRVPKVAGKIPNFLNKYFDPSYGLTAPETKDEVVSLCRLYNRLEFFIDRYFTDAMSNARLRIVDAYALQLAMEQGRTIPRVAMPFSITEKARLQRAFLQYSLYCQAFPWRPEPPYYDTAQMQYNLFLAHLPPFQLEELCCVQEYLAQYICKVFDDLEGRLVEDVRNTPGMVVPMTEKEASRIAPRPGQPTTLIPFQDLIENQLSMFSYVWRVQSPHYINGMTSFGLDLMRQLMQADESEHAMMLWKHCRSARVFLAEALNCMSAPPIDQVEPPTTDFDIMVADNPDYSNLGFLVYKNAPHWLVYRGFGHSVYKYSAMRKLGWVFWDTNRINQIQDRLIAARNINPFELYHQFGRDIESAEDLLKGVRLPMEEAKRVVREYGAPCLELNDHPNIVPNFPSFPEANFWGTLNHL